MTFVSRRMFVAGATSAFATLRISPAFAQTPSLQCVTSGLAAFLPNSLTTDCASRQNFRIFQSFPNYVGLTGVVSMSFVRGKFGEYTAGNLFLFPWLKKPGLALGTAYDWKSLMPLSATRTKAAGPIRGWTLPLDEYFCRFVLEAPHANFIGFRVDKPFGLVDSRRDRFSNVTLPNKKEIGISWASSNLNQPWFGGSRVIPKDSTCKGAEWRKLIVDGIGRASASVC